MTLPVRWHTWLLGVTAKRHRRFLTASLITLLTSLVLLGLVSFIQWRGRQALKRDTDVISAQAGEQLLRSLQSRRGTLTFIRDTINREPGLTTPELQAMGASAVQHTRHLTGIGLVYAGRGPGWWVVPSGLGESALTQLASDVLNRTRLRGSWSRPATFVVRTPAGRALLIMLEPLRVEVYQRSAVIGVFDLTRLLSDFFASGLAQRHPVRVLDGSTLLFESPSWQPVTAEHPPIVVEEPLALDAARWTVQVQPGSTQVGRTLSWANVLLVALSVVAGLGIILIVWILAVRNWILQRAVARRTAALRRVLERLRHLAVTDELTGLHNRRFFLNRWRWEYDRAKRYHRPLACLMIDLNGFKQVNDRLGHQAGDSLLKRVGQELQTALRQADILARFGGDEFIAALPETTPAQAELVADKLRQIRIPVAEGRTVVPPVSLSVGIGRLDADGVDHDLIREADEALYRQKRQLPGPAHPVPPVPSAHP